MENSNPCDSSQDDFSNRAVCFPGIVLPKEYNLMHSMHCALLVSSGIPRNFWQGERTQSFTKLPNKPMITLITNQSLAYCLLRTTNWWTRLLIPMSFTDLSCTTNARQGIVKTSAALLRAPTRKVKTMEVLAYTQFLNIVCLHVISWLLWSFTKNSY